jgi:superfamily II DNA or RNA helicase
MILRRHQEDAARASERVLSGEISRLYISVTPGGGKSAIPGIIAEKLMGKLIDRILWVVPRNSLRDQGESDFPEWSRFRIRAAGNEVDPCRGAIGYVTTYQAIVADPARHLANICDSRRWAIILDEFHHVLDGGEWYRALDPIVRRAALFVPMSGTLARGDGQRIAWMLYDAAGRPDLESDLRAAVVRYSRSDALREGAIVPVHFRHLDGRAEWEDIDGTLRSADTLGRGDYAADALFTALRTEYAYQLLDACTADWIQHRAEVFPGGKLLVVAPTIPLAEQYLGHLQRRGIDALIATSDDSPAAREAIARFKGRAIPGTDVLVTVAMAYEGMSVPAVSHIACLTHIRSVPWLEQCFARANRTAPGKVAGYVFGPMDKRLMAAIKAIEDEQAQALKDLAESDWAKAPASPEASGGIGRPTIKPIGSQAYGHDGMIILPPIQRPDGGLTPREAEHLLRTEIAKHIDAYIGQKRAGSKAAYMRIIHATLKDAVGGKARESCTVDELAAQMAVLKERWPVC